MRRNTDKRYRGGFYWRCAVKDRAQASRYWYERMPATVRYPRQLRDRRKKALARRRERLAKGVVTYR